MLKAAPATFPAGLNAVPIKDTALVPVARVGPEYAVPHFVDSSHGYASTDTDVEPPASMLLTGGLKTTDCIEVAQPLAGKAVRVPNPGFHKYAKQ